MRRRGPRVVCARVVLCHGVRFPRVTKAFPKQDSLACRLSLHQAFPPNACGACLEAGWGRSTPGCSALWAGKSPQAAAGGPSAKPCLVLQRGQLLLLSGVLRMQRPCWEGLWGAGLSLRPLLRASRRGGESSRTCWGDTVPISALGRTFPGKGCCYSPSCRGPEEPELPTASVGHSVARCSGLSLGVSFGALQSTAVGVCGRPLFLPL